MLTPQYLKEQPQHIVNIYLDLENKIIADISRRIKQNIELTETAEYQAKVLVEMGYDLADIEEKISKTTNISQNKIRKLFESSAELSYNHERKLYKKAGKDLKPLDKNIKMIDFIEATIKQTQGTMRNLSNTMGFVSNRQFMRIPNFYRNTIDTAILQVSTGAFDYTTVLRQAVNKLGDSGLRTIDYNSGRKYHIESAVRMNVLTGLSQITGFMSEANADEMGQDLMEITAHIGARPDHKIWQGEIVSRSGTKRGFLTLDDIGYGDVDGFKGANCRHDWFPFFEGISTPTYTEKELENIDPPDFEYEGKIYTAYDATQKQRQIERNIRETKRKLIAYDSAGLKDDFNAYSVKWRRQKELYRDFSNKAGLREKKERQHTYGYNRSIAGKAGYAGRR